MLLLWAHQISYGVQCPHDGDDDQFPIEPKLRLRRLLLVPAYHVANDQGMRRRVKRLNNETKQKDHKKRFRTCTGGRSNLAGIIVFTCLVPRNVTTLTASEWTTESAICMCISRYLCQWLSWASRALGICNQPNHTRSRGLQRSNSDESCSFHGVRNTKDYRVLRKPCTACGSGLGPVGDRLSTSRASADTNFKTM